MANNTHNEHEEENDFNTISDMPWFRPWLLVAFLAVIIAVLVRGCKETYRHETLTIAPSTTANAHGEETTTNIEEVTTSTIGNGSGYDFITYVTKLDTFMVENPTTKAVEMKIVDSKLSTVRLPNNAMLNTQRNSIEEKLAVYLNNTASVVDKTTWFDFDNLNFETGKAKLTAESNVQLNRVVELLKAYPKVKLKVGAYTDNVGDSLKNTNLSTARATTTVAALVSLGISANRLQAEGYGPMHPIADNATEEGRAKNRRVSVRVTEK